MSKCCCQRKSKSLNERSNKSKEKYADSLFSVISYLQVSLLIWFAAPFYKILDKIITDPEKYKNMGIYEAIVSIISFLSNGWAYLLWLIILVGIIVLAKDIERSAMNIYDEISMDNERESSL